jgi:hypothetical protein
MFVPYAAGIFSRGLSHTQTGAMNIVLTLVIRCLRSLTESNREQALGVFLSVVSTPAALVWIVAQSHEGEDN